MIPVPCPALDRGRTLWRLIEPDVSAAFDAALRELLSACFTGPQDDSFRVQRFWQERPARHYVVCEPDGRPIAQASCHDKRLGTSGADVRVGGVGDVCVHPAARGGGLVRVMLTALHEDLREQGIAFAMLFGEANVYRSSGYVPITNPVRYREFASHEWRTRVHPDAMIAPLGEVAWPEGELDLRGPLF